MELTNKITAAQNVVDDANATAQELGSAYTALREKIAALQLKVTEQYNIGLGRPVVVSETSNGVKENINDGNPDSKWDSNSIKSGTGDAAQDIGDAWFVIDLGEQANLIDELKVAYFNKVYPTEYEVQVSNDYANWMTVKTLTRVHNGTTYPKDDILFETPISARYVRMLFKELNNVAAGDGVGINEAEVIGRYIYEDVSVQEVETFENIVAEKGSEFDSTQLADTAKVQLAVAGMVENLAAYVPVSWNTSGLDTSIANTYALEGSLSLNGVTNAGDVKASVRVIVTQYAEFLGGSLRMDSGNYDQTSMRFGYEFPNIEGMTVTSWKWNWGLSENALTRERSGENKKDTENGFISNLVITGIPRDAFETVVYARLSITYTNTSGKELTVDTGIQRMSVKNVADAILAADSGATESEKEYAGEIIGTPAT